MQAFTKLTGIAAPLPKANVDTDQIIPARFLKSISRLGFGKNLFANFRFKEDGTENPDFVLNQEPYRKAEVLIAFENFGCGSSREHAVWAIYDGGFRAVIAPSFGDIFFNNALKNGLLPIRLSEANVSHLFSLTQQDAGLKVMIDLLAQTVVANSVFKASFEIDKFSKQCFLEGLDELGYTLSLIPQIEAFEKKRFS